MYNNMDSQLGVSEAPGSAMLDYEFLFFVRFPIWNGSLSAQRLRWLYTTFSAQKGFRAPDLPVL
jgi:hypothetical protein